MISDPAGVSLPPLAANALKPDGRVDLPAVLIRIAGNPRQIPLLIRAGRDARVAFAALRRARGLLQLGLGLGREPCNRFSVFHYSSTRCIIHFFGTRQCAGAHTLAQPV